MAQLLPALLCIFIMAYVIYLEFKDPKYGRDMFVDISISVIILIVGIYSMYEFKFDPHVNAFWAYVVLLILGGFYIGLVVYHEKHPKEKQDDKSIDDMPLEQVDDQSNPEEQVENKENTLDK